METVHSLSPRNDVSVDEMSGNSKHSERGNSETGSHSYRKLIVKKVGEDMHKGRMYLELLVLAFMYFLRSPCQRETPDDRPCGFQHGRCGILTGFRQMVVQTIMKCDFSNDPLGAVVL